VFSLTPLFHAHSECSVVSSCCYTIAQNYRYTLLPENISLLSFCCKCFNLCSCVTHASKHSCIIYLVLLHPVHYSTHSFISKCDCTTLQCFYKGCTQPHQRMALDSLFMYSIHCGRALLNTRDFDKLCGTAQRRILRPSICAERKCSRLKFYKICVFHFFLPRSVICMDQDTG
jgi:hypothetical protein